MLIVALLAAIHIVAGVFATLHFWRPRRLVDVPAISWLTALTTFYGGPILLGEITGWINRWTVWGAALTAAGLAAAAWVRHRNSAWSFTDIRGAVRRTAWAERLQWAVIGMIAIATLGLASVLPLRYADAAEYHSINPMRWAQTHRFDLEAFAAPGIKGHYRAGEVFPNVKAVLPFLVLEYTEKEDGTALAQWPFLVLLVVCLYGLFRRLAFPGWASACGVLFSLLAPEVLLQSLDGYADLMYFAGQMAVVYGCVLVWQEKAEWRGIAVSALAFAFLAGSKPTALMACGFLGLGFSTFVFWRLDAAAAGRRRQRAAAALALVLATCLVLAGPWYLRGLFEYSNPIYPVEVKIGERVLFPGEYGQSIANHFIEKNVGKGGLAAWWMMMNESYRLPILASHFAGLGPQALILGLPALVLFLVAGWTRDRRALYLPVTVLLVLLFLGSPVLLWPRMVLFQLALYGFAFVWLLGESPKPLRAVFLCLFVALGTYNVLRAVPAILHRVRPPELVAFPYLTGHRRHEQARTFPDEFTAVDFWREHLAREGRTLAVTELWPWLARPLERDASVLTVPRLGDTPVGDWADRLLDLKATHFCTRRAAPEFDAALSHPDRFRLVFHRLDSGAVTPLQVLAFEEGAVFELLPRRENAR